MATITEEMKEVASKTRGFAIATATMDGDPHLIPVAFGKVLSDDEILLMGIYMQKTLENIRMNPKVAVSVWDMESRKGYEFKGDAKIETSGAVFDEGVNMVKSRAPQLSPKAAVVVKVKSIYVRSPGSDAGKQL